MRFDEEFERRGLHPVLTADAARFPGKTLLRFIVLTRRGFIAFTFVR